jgi:hypothetical protein
MVIEDRGGKSGGRAAKAVGLTSGGLRCVPATGLRLPQGGLTAAQRVMASVEQFLAKRLKLKVNKAKSAVAKPNIRKFLGFSFTSERAAHRSAGARPLQGESP